MSQEAGARPAEPEPRVDTDNGGEGGAPDEVTHPSPLLFLLCTLLINYPGIGSEQ